MRVRTSTIALALIMVCGLSRAAIDYSQAKDIFPAGAQDYCTDDAGEHGGAGGKYRAKQRDRWVAMVKLGSEWVLEDAIVTRSGKVTSRHGAPSYFFKRTAVPFKLGPITTAAITSIASINAGKSEVSFFFKQHQWRWVEWGNFGQTFYLTDGRTKWTTLNWPGWNDKLMVRAKVSIPAAYSKAEDSRDYQDGAYRLAWAGDINGDGLLDFIVAWQSKETWGDHLWIGERSRDTELRFKLVLSDGDGCS